MKYTIGIEIEVEVPPGWKPLGFAYIKIGERYLKNDGTVVKWVWSPKSNGLYLRVEREEEAKIAHDATVKLMKTLGETK